jgi:hypothetical protein
MVPQEMPLPGTRPTYRVIREEVGDYVTEYREGERFTTEVDTQARGYPVAALESPY